jgi:hypothetical protein
MKPWSSAAMLTAVCLTATVMGACGSPASPRAPVPCTPGDLGARFRGGGYATGNDFGTILIWNSGSSPCQLDGRVRFTALYANGGGDPEAHLNRPVLPLNLVLPAAMTRPAEQADPSAYVAAQLMGPERDDPQQPNGRCRAGNEVAPAMLQLSIGGLTLRVTNLDPDTPDGPGNSRAVYGCHGQVLLEEITGPDRHLRAGKA